MEIAKITSRVQLALSTDLFVSVFNSAPWNDQWTNETAFDLLTCYYNTPEFRGWMVSSGGQFVGCAVGNTEPHYSGPIFYLREMFIAAPFQRMGIGRRLMVNIKTDLEQAGTKTIVLFTRKRIFGYYNQFGFKQMEELGMMHYSASQG